MGKGRQDAIICRGITAAVRRSLPGARDPSGRDAQSSGSGCWYGIILTMRSLSISSCLAGSGCISSLRRLRWNTIEWKSFSIAPVSARDQAGK